MNDPNCQDINPLENVTNLDKSPDFCSKSEDPNFRQTTNSEENWKEEQTFKKTGFGSKINCDPITTGQIINDLKDPVKTAVYRYSKTLEGTDEAAMDMFRNIVVLDENGKAHTVPIIWGSQERAVAAILQDNVRKDDSLVIDRIKLPFMAIIDTNLEVDEKRFTYHKAKNLLRNRRKDSKPGFTVNEKYERDTVFGLARGTPVNVTYTLLAWTLSLQDMKQMLEQIIPRISPMGMIKVKGVNWEIPLKLTSIANNLNPELGENQRIIKYQFTMVAESYISMPISRNKAVLDIKTQITNDVDPEKIDEVYANLEKAVKELDCEGDNVL